MGLNGDFKGSMKDTWKEIFRLRRSHAVSDRPDKPGLMTRREVAQYLGVSPLTIYGWTSKKVIPFRKVGRLLRFDKSEIDAWTKESFEKAKAPR